MCLLVDLVCRLTGFRRDVYRGVLRRVLQARLTRRSKISTTTCWAARTNGYSNSNSNTVLQTLTCRGLPAIVHSSLCRSFRRFRPAILFSSFAIGYILDDHLSEITCTVVVCFSAFLLAEATPLRVRAHARYTLPRPSAVALSLPTERVDVRFCSFRLARRCGAFYFTKRWWYPPRRLVTPFRGGIPSPHPPPTRGMNDPTNANPPSPTNLWLRCPASSPWFWRVCT